MFFQSTTLIGPLGSFSITCRKIRTLDPQRGQGKRGGIRVIYLYLPEVRRFFLITAFGKNEKEDLTPQEKRAFTKVAEAIRSEVY